MVLKFKSTENISYDISKYYNGPDVDFKSRRVVGYIRSGILTILPNFIWDGCTPKFRIFGIIVGVPDFKKTYRASAIHDFLINYQAVHGLSRKLIDMIFEDVLRSESFKLTFLYAGAVHTYRKLTIYSNLVMITV